jgi:electron transfer flavoprotein alpha subunit
MADYKNIIVYGEIVEGQLSPVTRELLGGGRALADELGEKVVAVFIGNGISKSAGEAYAFGADTVYAVDNAALNYYETDSYLAAFTGILEHEQPRYILFGNTDQGADLGPRLAFKLGVAIATDCVELTVEAETKHLLVTKPVYGGLAMAMFTTDAFPEIAAVRPKSLIPIEKRDTVGEVSIVDGSNASSRVKVLEKVVEESQGIKIEDADVVVAGGRGIGDVEGFKKLEEVAKYLKGAVGASRVACDNEWAPTTIQVGITGKIVAPSVYLAIGISGASQHMSGCSRSKSIIAINKDANAPIFKQSHYGVVGDWKVVLSTFIDKLKSLG